jgi:hypothetical protein
VLLEAIGDPDPDEHHDYLNWVGGSFDPSKFDLAAINVALQRVRGVSRSRGGQHGSLAVVVPAVVNWLHPIFIGGDGFCATIDRQLLLEDVGLGLLGVVDVPPGIVAVLGNQLLQEICVRHRSLRRIGIYHCATPSIRDDPYIPTDGPG